jgi:hypothetical protein
MRLMSSAVGAAVVAIAVYFAVFWGADAVRTLTSPTFGLDDIWRSQVTFGIARYAGIGPEGYLTLSAVIGALKLTVAAVCIFYIAVRARAFFRGGEAGSEALETGLLLAAAVSIVSLIPAAWSHNGALARELTLQLLLALIGAAACIVQRRSANGAGKSDESPAAPAVPQHWFVPWRR